jgi:hypothetical protein
MGSLPVVALGIGPERPIEMPSTENEGPVEALGPDRLDHALGAGMAFGARMGVKITQAPSERTTSSNGRLNFVSRSRMRKRMGHLGLSELVRVVQPSRDHRALS